ncbi:MAG: phosphoglycerate kinase [Phycisphaerales bacterium]|nr:phosphoglycerate kinase [Phycisphaerales bacterium]
MSRPTVMDLDCTDARVLVRVDFNVPLDQDGHVLDDRRIRMALPTIEHILKHNGIPVLMSHFGRPSGTGPEPDASLAPVASRLGSLLGSKHPVHFIEGNCRGESVTSAVSQAGIGEVVLLDNLRFDAGEKTNDPALSRDLAALGDAYVNDAFGTAHRAHASMVGVPQAMGDKPCVAGLLLAKELKFLSEAMEDPKRPFAAVLGGAKVSDKLGAIKHLLERVDLILVGGAMAYTFLQARGELIGRSLCEQDMLETAQELMRTAESRGVDLLLPQDHMCAEALAEGVTVRTCEIGIPEDLMGLDIGPETAAAWDQRLQKAATIVWNGPMGVFEQPPFDRGTTAIAKAIAHASKRHKAMSIVGGGETAAAVEQAGVAGRITHVSTGGGASLRMLEGAVLPGIEALDAGNPD